MKFVDEYRDAKAVADYARAIRRITTRPWRMMEICGGQTHTIVKFGIDQLLPESIELIHGPGCPVCVTPLALIDRAILLAQRPDVILCSFGDMLRVPGTTRDLLSVKAAGGHVQMVYSPLDALRLAEQNPTKQVVFFAVGFETTAPATAMAIYQARQQGSENFSLLVSHVTVPPAMELILSSPQCWVQGFLAAGHVCAIMGYHEYEPIAQRYGVPIVVTGFEPLDLLQGIFMCVRQLETGQARVENQYVRTVRRAGNLPAQALLREVFELVPRAWRGIGTISASGLGLRPEYAAFDAERRFRLGDEVPEESSSCISGLILQGIRKPATCPAFATHCTPEQPLGAPMVSSEGACAAYYRYRGAASGSEALTLEQRS